MKPTIIGRSALIEGPKYDLEKTFDAYARLIDAFAARFGGTCVTIAKPDARRIPWPAPGKALAHQIWTQLKGIHDVVDEPLLHPLGDGSIVLKAFLLGKTWCVQDARTGALTTPTGEPVSRLDPVPTVCIYGKLSPDGSHGLVSGDVMDDIGLMLAGPVLRDLRLGFDRTTINVPASAASGLMDYAYATFPHDVYGDGRDWLNVRCVSSDGGDPDPQGYEN